MGWEKVETLSMARMCNWLENHSCGHQLQFGMCSGHLGGHRWYNWYLWKIKSEAFIGNDLHSCRSYRIAAKITSNTLIMIVGIKSPIILACDKYFFLVSVIFKEKIFHTWIVGCHMPGHISMSRDPVIFHVIENWWIDTACPNKLRKLCAKKSV